MPISKKRRLPTRSSTCWPNAASTSAPAAVPPPNAVRGRPPARSRRPRGRPAGSVPARPGVTRSPRADRLLLLIGARRTILHDRAFDQKQLVDSERRMTPGPEILEALPVAVYITDAEGRITFYNQAAADLWGHRPKL